MKKPILKPVSFQGTADLLEKSQGTSVNVENTHTQELVIGLCGPIGSQIHKVGEIIAERLEHDYGYECHNIRLSTLIDGFPDEVNSGNREKETKYERTQRLIKKGNELRNRRYSILADLAILQIAQDREERKTKDGSKDYQGKRVCHIVDSNKNKSEYDALKSVYRDLFYFVGVHSPLESRVNSLTSNNQMSLSEVHQLIDQDSGEEIANGQSVRDTFPLADIFLRASENTDSEDAIQKKVDRFLSLIFDIDVVTPTKEETAMYRASTAALNSACLSRQVGASITDEECNVINVGWNDVPKYGGNVYTESSSSDFRCKVRSLNSGYCSNDMEKANIVNEILSGLIKYGVFSEEKRQQAIKAIKETRVTGLIEFSRSIHAEMHALMIGAQQAGSKIRDGKLFCTTYPCHSCARHIVLSGIKEIYYIEPYRKSLAIKLHSDSITESETEPNKVKLLQFDGVAPSRYNKLFSMASEDSRKEKYSGKMVRNNKKEANPKYEVSIESIPALEGIVIKNLSDNGIVEL
jgi:deoxycytidylate deaminase